MKSLKFSELPLMSVVWHGGFHYLCNMKLKIGIDITIMTVAICLVSLVSFSAMADSCSQARYALNRGKVELTYGDSIRCVSGDATDIGRPKRLYLANNRSRECISLDMVHPGSKHSPDILPYTGKGVVIGIIDCGIDPNHITFRDSEGNSRVRKYIFTESSLESADGKLHAAAFNTPEEILCAPVDSAEGGHGTHTTATAAGSWRGNPYYGMATDAELVLTGTGAYSYDDEIIYGMRAAGEYASANGKRAVISISLASGIGPHDGTSAVGLVSNELRRQGDFICFAAGNDGKRSSTIIRDFSTDTAAVRSIFCKWYNGPTHLCPMEAWSSDTTSAEFQLLVTQHDSVRFVSRWITPEEVSAAGGRLVLLSDKEAGERLPELRRHVKGEISCETGVYSPNNRFRIHLDADVVQYLDSGFQPQLAFGIRSKGGAKMRIYADAYFNQLGDWGSAYFTNGLPGENVSDLASSPDVFAVGMMNANRSQTTLTGHTYTLESMKFGEYGKPNLNSSRGTTWEGATLPHILAPGSLVVSALYPEAPGMEKCYVTDTVIDSKRYVWGFDSGTSMSTPTVAGILAVWLEALPTLTYDNIIEILRETGNRSALDGYPGYSAYGTIDAFEGLKYALRKFSTPAIEVDTQHKLSIRFLGKSTPGSLIEVLTSRNIGNGTARFIAMNGHTVCSIPVSGTDFTLPLPDSSGIYILQVVGDGFSASQKIVTVY